VTLTHVHREVDPPHRLPSDPSPASQIAPRVLIERRQKRKEHSLQADFFVCGIRGRSANPGFLAHDSSPPMAPLHVSHDAKPRPVRVWRITALTALTNHEPESFTAFFPLLLSPDDGHTLSLQEVIEFGHLPRPRDRPKLAVAQPTDRAGSSALGFPNPCGRDCNEEKGGSTK
jgi:hypothetical protein